MITNGIQHNLKKFQLVTWGDSNTVLEILNITAKRIVCKEIGCITSDAKIQLNGKNLCSKGYTPENLQEIEPWIAKRRVAA